MVASSTSFSAMMALAVLAAQVNGHGYMSVPKVEFTINGDFTQFIGTIESSASGFSGTFNSDPATNTASFTKAFGSSEYKSLKEFVTEKMTTISGATKECGLSNPDETPQPLPDTYVEWAHSNSEGFTPSHEGPCEIWCDDTRVFQDDDCAAHYTSAPAKLKYDRASCVGASRLTFYWLALHSSTWQVYVNCAALDGSSSSTEITSSTGTTSSGITSSTSTNSTASTSSGSSTTSTYTPSTTTSTTPTAPSTSTTDSSSTSISTSASTTTTAPSTDSTGSASTSTWNTPSTTTATSTSSGTASSGQASTSSGATGTTWGWGNTKSGNSNSGGIWPSGNSFGFWV